MIISINHEGREITADVQSLGPTLKFNEVYDSRTHELITEVSDTLKESFHREFLRRSERAEERGQAILDGTHEDEDGGMSIEEYLEKYEE